MSDLRYVNLFISGADPDTILVIGAPLLATLAFGLSLCPEIDNTHGQVAFGKYIDQIPTLILIPQPVVG